MKKSLFFTFLYIILTLVFLYAKVNSLYKDVEFCYPYNSSIKSVYLVGSFNNWRILENYKLKFNGRRFVKKLKLIPGVYEYKYVIDGSWRYLENKPFIRYNKGIVNNIKYVGRFNKVMPYLFKENLFPYVEVMYSYVKITFIAKKNMLSKLDLITYDGNEEKIYSMVKLEGVYFDHFQLILDKKDFHYFFKLYTIDNNIKYFSKNRISLTKPSVESYFCFYKKDSKITYKYPKWISKVILYQIFVDRFFNADKENDPEDVQDWGAKPEYFNYFGGDLKGVIQKIDYIKDLGINLIYFNPIFEAESNHKYNTKDYLKIDPHFGNLNIFMQLLNLYHKNNIKIILDGVFNHTGTKFFAFQDILNKQQKSKYVNWYYIKKFPVEEKKDPNYECWWNFASLPKLNLHNKDTYNYIKNVVEYWTSKGIDGWRLDVPNEIGHWFFIDFRKWVKSINPDAYILGEIWTEDNLWLLGDEFDGNMNYPFRKQIISFLVHKTIDSATFSKLNQFSILQRYWGANLSMANLLSSHDVKRFLTVCNNDTSLFKLGYIITFTYVGVPYIYYADEVGMKGGKDPDNRRCFNWNKDKWNRDLLNFFKKLIVIRKTQKALQDGILRFLKTNDEDILAYERIFKEERILVLINRADIDKFFKFNNKKNYIDLFTLKEYSVIKIKIPAKGFYILKEKF